MESIASVWHGDTQPIESINSIVRMIGERCPRIDLAGMTSRIIIKKALASLAGSFSSDPTRKVVVKNRSVMREHAGRLLPGLNGSGDSSYSLKWRRLVEGWRKTFGAATKHSALSGLLMQGSSLGSLLEKKPILNQGPVEKDDDDDDDKADKQSLFDLVAQNECDEELVGLCSCCLLAHQICGGSLVLALRIRIGIGIRLRRLRPRLRLWLSFQWSVVCRQSSVCRVMSCQLSLDGPMVRSLHAQFHGPHDESSWFIVHGPLNLRSP